MTISSQQGNLTTSVKNFGIGIPVQVLQKVFTLLLKKVDCSSIDLTICREISDGHQGQTTLNNYPEGGVQV
jgi:two-component system nitrogen regulation sensor histidine kinase NtrY